MMAELIDTTRQVRLPDLRVHRLKRRLDFRPDTGHRYETGCRDVLTGDQGAMLTTHRVNCPACGYEP